LVVDDAVLRAFREYLREQKFDYQSELEQEFTRFDSLAAKHAADYPALSGQLAGIKTVLAQDDERDFQRHLARVRYRIKMELAARFWGNEGRIRASLESDQQLEQAVTLITDRKKYRELLAAASAKDGHHK
jgi:carboxyl-terminal processing protease